MNIKRTLYKYLGAACISVTFLACKNLASVSKVANKTVPASYNNSTDSINSAKTQWKDFFRDPQLAALIDSALKKNQELNSVLQEIQIAKNEVRAKRGAFLPFMNAGLGANVENDAAE